MKKVEAIIRSEKLADVQSSLLATGFGGFVVSDVRGHGAEASQVGEYRGTPFTMSVKHKLMVEVVVDDDEVPEVIRCISDAAVTGQVGDGIITVIDVVEVHQIRTGLTDHAAVHD